MSSDQMLNELPLELTICICLGCVVLMHALASICTSSPDAIDRHLLRLVRSIIAWFFLPQDLGTRLPSIDLWKQVVLDYYSPTHEQILRMPSKKTSHQQKWSMYASLHRDVSQLLRDEDLNYTFLKAHDNETFIKEYDTQIRGRFFCHNKACSSNGWVSGQISITIRLYENQRYNARVYHQGCEKCLHLSRPILDETYAERVAYRIKRWAGISMERPPYSQKKGQKPHRSDLCEGCKAGHCSNLAMAER